jgi:hypothetical protein
MHKRSSKDMVKVSLWMHKKEFKKIAELSGDLSMSVFIMRAVRKQIEEEEERKQRPLLQDASQVVGGPHKRQTAGAGRTPFKVRKERSMVEIRRLAAEGYSHNEIMKQLELPRTTYFRYLSAAFEHDRQLLKQENNPAMLALEISRITDTFNAAIRKIDEIANSPKATARQKIAACDEMCRIAVAILQLQYQGPLIMNKALKDIDLSWHFKKPFSSGEVDFV